MEEEIKVFLGVGMKFPPQIDALTGAFKTSSYEEDIKEAIYIILMTIPGERVMEPEFGCDIKKYIFEIANATYMNLLKLEVIRSLERWEPRIKDVEVTVENTDLIHSKITLSIGYTVCATNNKDNLVFPYYLEEGGE